MAKKAVRSDNVYSTKKPYVQGIETSGGRLIFTSGLIARDLDGNVTGKGDIRAQTRQCLENIGGIFEAAGGSMNDLVKMTVFLSDLANYQGMNEMRQEMLDGIEFASSTVEVALNEKDALIEIEAVAAVGE